MTTSLRLATVAILALATGCSKAIDQTKFAAVHRAARATRESVGTGLNLLRMQELVQTYATEVSLAKDHASSDVETGFVRVHEHALDAYRDSLIFWRSKLDRDQMTDALRVRYGMTNYSADDGIQRAWSRASANLDAADRMFRGDAAGLESAESQWQQEKEAVAAREAADTKRNFEEARQQILSAALVSLSPEPKRIRYVAPVYPAIAKSAKVQGIVGVRVTIDGGGNVSEVQVNKSIPLLDAAALLAVRDWTYARPTDGRPTTFLTDVTFSLPR